MDTTPSESGGCVACGGALEFFGPRLGYEYHRCTGCLSIQLWPPPDKEAVAKAYELEFATNSRMDPDPASSRRAIDAPCRVILDTLGRFQPVGRVIEFGPGWGCMAGLLVDAGYEYQGVEPSRDMAEECGRLGLSVVHGDIEAVEGQQCDAIVMRAVFEHIIDYEDWLSRAGALLVAKGYLVTSQPTAPFAAFFSQLFRLGNVEKTLPELRDIICPPWHNVLFSLSGMTTLMGRHGFELVEVLPSTQARDRGLAGIMQRTLEYTNRVGYLLFGLKWPLLLGHTFVFRRAGVDDE